MDQIVLRILAMQQAKTVKCAKFYINFGCKVLYGTMPVHRCNFRIINTLQMVNDPLKKNGVLAWCLIGIKRK